MPFDAPFMLGPFAVDMMGRLSPRTSDTMPGFWCRWRDRKIHARFEPSDPDQSKLVLQVVLGRVPSTASRGEGDLRQQSFQLLRLLPQMIPGPWRLVLLPDHRVTLEADTQVSLPNTATELLVAVTRFLLDLACYLDLLEEVGIAGASVAAGTAMT
jgi:hypothetical protein